LKSSTSAVVEVDGARTASVRQREVGSWAVLLLHALVFAGLAWWSWLKWPDPLIDFGRELYVPWQITTGKVLYRDIASLFGPLSPYVNALWMRLFGASLMTLVVCNLVIFTAVLTGIYRLLLLSSDRLTASVATLAALVLSGFLQLGPVANYNFVTPYSHEATHGFALAVVVLLAWHRALARRTVLPAWVAGVAFGGVLLTKPEPLLATGFAVAAATVFAVSIGVVPAGHLRRAIPVFAVAALLPPLGFFVHFSTHMDALGALEAVTTAVRAPFHAGFAKNPFYLAGMGLDRPALNALRMAWMFGAFVLFLALLTAACWTPLQRRSLRYLQIVGRPLLVVAAALWIGSGAPRALPLIALTVAVVIIIQSTKGRAQPGELPRRLMLFMWSAFAFALLAKIGLFGRVHHYGFVLALPAVTLVVVLLCSLMPATLARVGSPAAANRFRACGALAVAAAVLPALVFSSVPYATKTLWVGAGADRFLASAGPRSRGAGVAEALAATLSVRAPGDMLAVLPEGVMVNYLGRLESPLGVTSLMPPEHLAFGEDDVLHRLEATRPRLVLLVERDVSEYGYPPFGTDARYGRRIYEWVTASYQPIRTIGNGTGDGSSMILFERR
jgi:hypothetical protein